MSQSEIVINNALAKLDAWMERILNYLWGKYEAKLGLDEIDE